MKRFVSWFVAHPLLGSVLLAIIWRGLAAFSGIGWFAMDDYSYVIRPAAAWLQDPLALFPSSYRSLFFPKLFSLLLSFAQSLGATTPARQLQVAYMGLGLWNVLGVPAAYILGDFFSKRAATIAALLWAGFVLMPYLASRALIEVVAMVPLAWAFVCFQLGQKDTRLGQLSWFFLGGIAFGLAAMFRFQVGVMGFGIIAVLSWNLWKTPPKTPYLEKWAPMLGLTAAGILMLSVQGALDMGVGRPFLSTIWHYFTFNVAYSSKFGVSSGWNYIFQLLAYTIPPTTLFLIRPMWKAAFRMPLLSLCLAIFVIAHALVPHKEDRFLFPILPLWLMWVAVGLAELNIEYKWQRWAFYWFWLINGAGLIIATFSDANKNITAPLSYISTQPGTPSVWVFKIKPVAEYYAGNSAMVLKVRDETKLEQTFAKYQKGPDYLLARPTSASLAIDWLKGHNWFCDMPKIFEGDWIDQLLVWLNPEHNQRRSATVLLTCRSTGTN